MSELPKWLVDWAQVLGAGLSLLALVLALFALNKSKRDLAKERRHAHELDVLRDIGNLIDQTPSFDLVRLLRTQLLLLQGHDMPTVRVAVRANPPASAVTAFDTQHAGELEEVELEEVKGLDPEQQSLRRFEIIRKDRIDRAELDEAIAKRLRS